MILPQRPQRKDTQRAQSENYALDSNLIRENPFNPRHRCSHKILSIGLFERSKIIHPEYFPAKAAKNAKLTK